MATTITSPSTYINPTPFFSGMTTEPTVVVTFRGKSYSANVNAGQWYLTIPQVDAISIDGYYTVTANEASATILFAGPLDFDRDVPVFTIPEPATALAPATAAVANATNTFVQFNSDTSSSCDLLGTVQSLASELTRTVYDAAGEVIGVVKESTAAISASIKNAVGDVFGGAGGTLNTLKGYVNSALGWAGEVKSAITESAQEAIQWVRDLVANGQSMTADLIMAAREKIAGVKASVEGFISSATAKFSEITNTIQSAANDVKDFMQTVSGKVGEIAGMVGKAVRGISVATCSALNSVLAGTPDDAFANLTEGATDAGLKALGSAKEAFNSGLSNISELKSKITDATGIGDTLGSAKDAISNIASNVSALSTSATSTVTEKLGSMRGFLAEKPVMPA